MIKEKPKTKDQLLDEISVLRERLSRLERMETRHRKLDEMWRRYEFIVNTSKEFLSLIDRHYVYEAANHAYCLAHNKRHDDIVNQSVSDIWGEEIFVSVIKRYLDTCFEGNEVRYQAQFQFPAIGLRTMDVTYYPYYSKEGTVTHAVVVSRDITEQKTAEKELLALKKAVETMQLGVTITDTEGRILYTNPAEAHMHGYSVDEMMNQDVKMLAPFELWNPRTAAKLDEIRSWRRECVNLRKDKTVFPVQLMSDVVRSQEGLPIGVVTTCEDITERRRSEEQIKRQLQYLTSLREIDMVILSSLDIRVVLNVLLSHLINQLKIDAAVVMILNPHTLMLEYAEGRGFRSHAIRYASVKLGEGLAGQVALERTRISIANLQERGICYLNPAFLQEENLTSYFGLPLIAKGQVKGTLEIFRHTYREPEPEWLDFMEALAGQAAIAIDNATMFDDLQHSNVELSLAYDTTLDGWSRALDLRDKETEGHSQRVTELTMRIARAIGMSDSELVHVRRGALLHDIGKMGIPDNILLKAGPLTDEEWVVMRRHPVYAYEMLSHINFLRPAIDIPYCHHEKWDGTGYPRGLKGKEIPISARIFMVADIWDALCSSRSYRPAFSEERAIAHMRSLSGSHLDPDVLKIFLDMLQT